MTLLSGPALWLRLVVIGALWGAAFPLIRFLAFHFPPFTMAAVRGTLASVAVLAFLWWRRQLGALDRRVAFAALVLGTLNGVLPNTLMPLALVRIEAAPASLVQAAGPLVVTLLAAAFLPGEAPSRRMLGGVALGFAGIALVVGPGGLEGGSLAGAALVFCATFSYAVGTIWLRIAPRGGAAALALGQQAVSGVLSGLLALGVDGTAALAQPASIWAVAVVLAVFSTAVPLTLFLGLVTRARAADASMVGYLQPVFATLIAATWLREVPSWPTLAGGAVVLAAVWLVTSRR